MKIRGGCRHPPVFGGSNLANFWRRRPREPWFCGPNAGHFASPISDPGNLPLWRWGVDNFAFLAGSEVSDSAEVADLELTTGPFSETPPRFGPVASSELPVWQRPAFFQQHRHEFAAKHTSFRQKVHRCPELHGLRPRGRQLWFAAVDFSLETGPKLPSGTHDRPNTNKQP